MDANYNMNINLNQHRRRIIDLHNRRQELLDVFHDRMEQLNQILNVDADAVGGAEDNANQNGNANANANDNRNRNVPPENLRLPYEDVRPWNFVYAFSEFLLILYWCTISGGIFVVMFVLSMTDNMQFLHNRNKSVMLFILPMLTFFIIAVEILHTRRSFIDLLKKMAIRARTVNVMPADNEEFHNEMINAVIVVTSVLIIPVIGAFAGEYFFKHISNPIERGVMGGISTLIAKQAIIVILKIVKYALKTNQNNHAHQE